MIFGRKLQRAKSVRVVIPVRALEVIFDECDRHNVDETGGRLIGSYCENGDQLKIAISGVIEPGPAAQRSNTSFFQDGEFQERVFRSVEREHPEVEHLGNWHTHHVNGLPHLSGGDVTTYTRTVNHDNHNTSFFYALLVTAKEPARSAQRYRVKHYVLRRGEATLYEIDSSHVEVTEADLLWPTARSASSATTRGTRAISAHEQKTSIAASIRAQDDAALNDLYGQLRAFTSPKVGLFWRGPIELVDGTVTEVIVVEDASGVEPQYTVGFPQPRDVLGTVAADIAQRRFPSARSALIQAERACNRALFADALRPATI